MAFVAHFMPAFSLGKERDSNKYQNNDITIVNE